MGALHGERGPPVVGGEAEEAGVGGVHARVKVGSRQVVDLGHGQRRERLRHVDVLRRKIKAHVARHFQESLCAAGDTIR